MKNCVKTELWKATHNPMFYAALFIGCLIALVNVFENGILAKELSEYILSDDYVGSRSPWGFSLFLLWLPVNVISYVTALFSMVWPILAAMPFGWSYLQESRGGLYRQIAVRVGRRACYAAKYIAAFVSGGLAVAIPILFNLLVNARICPDVLPNIMNYVQIGDGYFLSELYFTVPWAYALIWCAVTFLLGGAAAGLCFLVGTKPRFQVMAILTPFALLMVLDGIYTAAYERGYHALELSPMRLAMAVPSTPNPEWLVFIAFMAMTILGFAVGYWQVVRHELV